MHTLKIQNYSFYHFVESLLILIDNYILKSILSDVELAVATQFWLVFIQYIFFYFNLLLLIFLCPYVLKDTMLNKQYRAFVFFYLFWQLF